MDLSRNFRPMIGTDGRGLYKALPLYLARVLLLHGLVLLLLTGSSAGSAESQTVRPSGDRICFVNDTITLRCGDILKTSDLVTTWFYSPNSFSRRIKIFESSVGLLPEAESFNFSVVGDRDLCIGLVQDFHTGTYICERRSLKFNARDELKEQRFQLLVSHERPCTAGDRHLESSSDLIQYLGISCLIILVFIIIYKSMIVHKLSQKKKEKEQDLTDVIDKPKDETVRMVYAID